MADLGTLRTLLDPMGSAPVEWNGFARLASTVLRNAGIPHTVFLGALSCGGRIVSPHLWIKVGPWWVDYRARLWLGSSTDIPHGIFKIDSPCEAQYAGSAIQLDPLSPILFEILRTPIPLTSQQGCSPCGS